MVDLKGIITNILKCILIVAIFPGCTPEIQNPEFFPGEYPGKPEAVIGKDKIMLFNKAIDAEWSLQANSIVLEKVKNKYDNQTVGLNHVTLFAIELEGGKRLTNHDFKLEGVLKIQNLVATDTLPTKALRFPGKEIVGRFVSADKALAIDWKAQLREGSNYIRQNIEIKSVKKAVKLNKVVFLDGKLEGATYAGSVMGSPIEYKNFFFGLEQPITQSRALLSRDLGEITQEYFDVSDIIDAPGEYIISVEHGGGPANFNIQSVSLIEDNLPVSVDEHPLNGENGSSTYRLKLGKYNPKGRYKIHADIVNTPNATGTFHIFRKIDGILNFFVTRVDELVSGKSISEWLSIGVSPIDQKRRAFQYYLERERARPYKQFLHYNCWWDITTDWASSFTSEQMIERMHAWHDKFIEPYGVQLQSFVFDDGWDNLDSVWYFDPVNFPNGFAPQAELCKKYNSGIGVWMSPFGGYLENKRRRIESAHREGLETNDKGLSLAGENYYNRFLGRALDMLDNYKVNYFKFDGLGGSEPKYLPDMEAGARMIKTLRQHNPDVFVNITMGSWPSPFWLKYADCTWRGSGDAHLAGVGSRTQQFITYRDGTLHNNIVNRAPYYPLNSIMVVGITYANLGLSLECVNDSIEDFKDMVWSFFGAGSSLQELYISHDRMKPGFWAVLAEAAKWSKANEKVLQDVHWIGGSPINLEVYGYAAWKPEKGIITLRNPSGKPQIFLLDLQRIFELPQGGPEEYTLANRLGGKGVNYDVRISKPLEITIKPFDVMVLEAVPKKLKNKYLVQDVCLQGFRSLKNQKPSG